MKTAKVLTNTLLGAPLSALLAFGLTLHANAQTWHNVLVYQLAAGKSAGGNCLAADAAGNVFSGGWGNGTAGYGQGLVLRTDTTEASWFLSDDTDPNPGYYESEVYALGFDANRNLYSAGQLWPDGGLLPPYWQVRKSADLGLTWTTADLYQYPSGSWIDVTGITADNLGNVYVVGAAVDAAGNHHWLVRKSADAGQSWALVDDAMIGNNAAQAAFVPGVGIFVVGNQGTLGWTVRRSLDGGATWVTVDAPFGRGSGAWFVASDGAGNIYVLGSHSVATTSSTRGKTTVTYSPALWVTRESSDGGNTWLTVDTYALAQNEAAVGHGLGIAASGAVVAVGQANDAGGKHVSSSTHWIVRTPDASGVWQTVDDFQLLSGKNTTAHGVVTDAAGNLLVAGTASDYPSGYEWIVRKLP